MLQEVPEEPPFNISIILKTLLKELVHGFHLKELTLGFIADTEGRLPVDFIEKLPNHPQRKAVEGGDVGTVHPIQLPVHHRSALRHVLHVLPDGPSKLQLHLRRRRVGKCHHQHLIHVGFSLQDDVNNPLHQNCRLSGTRRRGDQNAFIQCIDCSLLIFCKMYAHSFLLL